MPRKIQTRLDEQGRKICNVCGRPEGEVRFFRTKNECNPCRAKKEVIHENTPERLFVVWKPRNKEKAKLFLKGKKDPCEICTSERCGYCIVYALKSKYIHPKDKSAKEFIAAFDKNLLENIRAVYNNS